MFALHKITMSVNTYEACVESVDSPSAVVPLSPATIITPPFPSSVDVVPLSPATIITTDSPYFTDTMTGMYVTGNTTKGPLTKIMKIGKAKKAKKYN